MATAIKQKELTSKQRRFTKEYLVDLNATQAAIRAGYSAKRADAIGHENLRKPVIAEAIQEAKNSRSERCQIDADYVLSRLVEIDQTNIGDILNDDLTVKPPGEWPSIWRSFPPAFETYKDDAGKVYVKRFRGLDKLKTLELIGKHTGVSAFKGKDAEESIEKRIEKYGVRRISTADLMEFIMSGSEWKRWKKSKDERLKKVEL